MPINPNIRNISKKLAENSNYFIFKKIIDDYSGIIGILGRIFGIIGIYSLIGVFKLLPMIVFAINQSHKFLVKCYFVFICKFTFMHELTPSKTQIFFEIFRRVRSHEDLTLKKNNQKSTKDGRKIFEDLKKIFMCDIMRFGSWAPH